MLKDNKNKALKEVFKLIYLPKFLPKNANKLTVFRFSF